MSLREYSELLKEGLRASSARGGEGCGESGGEGSGGDAPLRVEHVLVVSLDPALLQLAHLWLDAARSATFAASRFAVGCSLVVGIVGALHLASSWRFRRLPTSNKNPEPDRRDNRDGTGRRASSE